MKRAGLFFAIIFVLSTVSVYAQSYTITVTMRDKASGRGIMEFSPIGLNQEVFFDPATPLTPGRTYSGEVSMMTLAKRRGIIITGNGIGPETGIFIHEGQYSGAWSRGCIVLETNGFNQLYDFLERNVGLNRAGRISIVIRQ
jgi:hypothetical protein